MTEIEVRKSLSECYPDMQYFFISTILLWAEWSTEEECGFLIIYRDMNGEMFVQEDGYPVMVDQPMMWDPDPILYVDVPGRLVGWEEDIKYNNLDGFL